jgi:hypothetical protein
VVRELPYTTERTLFTSKELLKLWRAENERSTSGEPAIVRALKNARYRTGERGEANQGTR